MRINKRYTRPFLPRHPGLGVPDEVPVVWRMPETRLEDQLATSAAIRQSLLSRILPLPMKLRRARSGRKGQ